MLRIRIRHIPEPQEAGAEEVVAEAAGVEQPLRTAVRAPEPPAQVAGAGEGAEGEAR